MSRVVHLHIGAPKTGTTYLQDRLRLNEQTLASHGVTVPSPRVGRSDTVAVYVTRSLRIPA